MAVGGLVLGVVTGVVLARLARRREIWSGGQTGVDRAAWDAARDLGIPIAGWVPRGRLAEDGRIPEVYPHLREAGSEDYAERTARNVHDSDATLILYRGTLSGGSAFTHGEALRLGRPVLAVELSGVQPRDRLPQVRASHSRLRWRRRQDWLGH